MKEMVIKTHTFGKDAMNLLACSGKIAKMLGNGEVMCSHVFVSLMMTEPEILHALIGRPLTRLPEKYNLPLSLTADEEPPVNFADEFSTLFLDSTPGTPLQRIMEYFPGRIIGTAEIAFLLMMDPTEEIGDILLNNDVPNDTAVLERILWENYLKNALAFCRVPQRDRLSAAIAAGEQFKQIMKRELVGQTKAIESTADLLTDFWYRGNRGLPLRILLISKAGGGRSFFAETMQRAFVEMGLQTKVEIPLDLRGFLHDTSCEPDLLGDARSFRNARCGRLYELTRCNQRGVMVFEDILTGSRQAKGILRSFATNCAYDKFNEDVMLIPFNVLVFTLKVTDDQYRFLAEKCQEKDMDRHILDSLFLPSRTGEKGRVMLNSEAEAVSGAAGLWQVMDKFVLLQQMDEAELSTIASREAGRVRSRLENDFNIRFSCVELPGIIRLFQLSVPHEIGPGEMLDLMEKNLIRTLGRQIAGNHELEQVEFCCDPLPEYQFDPARRIIRGDYLTFRKEESNDGHVLKLTFKDIRYSTQERNDCGDYRIERPQHGISFDEIVGLDDVRDELLDSLDYISNRDKYPGKIPPPPLNYILYGPPGTGKTSLAVALAKAADIPVFFASSSIFSNTEKLADMFRKANEMAPAVVVLEELNSISNSSYVFKRDSINELLSILNGVQEAGKLLVLATTNHLEQIEEALLRPGRFGRKIRIGLPDKAARECYIQKFESKFGVLLDDEAREKFVSGTENISLAGVKAVLESALRVSIRKKSDFNFQRISEAMQKFAESRKQNEIGFCGGELEK